MSTAAVEQLGNVETPEERNPHLVRVKVLLFGLEAGVDVQAYCGAWVRPWDPFRKPGLLVVDGYLARDCDACVVAHAAAVARRLQG